MLKRHVQAQGDNTPCIEGKGGEDIILGFYISGRIFYCLEKKKLVDIDGRCNTITLRSTMAFLFEYLLTHGQDGIVTDSVGYMINPRSFLPMYSVKSQACT